MGCGCAHLAHLATHGGLLLLPLGPVLVALLELRRRLHLLDHAHLVPDRHELLRVPVYREVSRKWRGGAVTRKFDRHELLRVL